MMKVSSNQTPTAIGMRPDLVDLTPVKHLRGSKPVMAKPSVAVVCVTHARPELVQKCAASCARQNYPNFEIVIVINPVDPISEASVLAAAPTARIIRTHRNLGFFPALNIALANTEAEYVMIVDDDAWFVDDNALGCLVDEFLKMPSLGAVTCNLLGPHETPISGGDQFIRVFTTGFTMMPRRVVTEWVDYFPDVFFRSAGETFLCTQLWEQGRPVKRVESVRMFHALALTGRSMRDWHFYGLRSQILCALMREPLGWLFPVMISKFVKSFVFALRHRNLVLWFHAWCSASAHVGTALHYRKPVSYRTRRLLLRLDSTTVRDLSQCPEWRKQSAVQ
jgi:GT2 family glycosyltransferase